MFYQIISASRRPRKSVVETKPVVAATNPVPLGGVIKANDLKIVNWPSENIPPGSFNKIDEVVDRVAVSAILPEEPILAGRLAAKGSGLGLSPMIPPGMRAVSVRVNDVIGVAGFVLPGSRVDVLVTGVPRNEAQGGPVTKTILSNIQALSAGTNFQPDAKGQPVNVPVVTLLVTPEQAEILTLASSEGRIQLTLRNNVDDNRPSTLGVRAAEIFTGVARAEKPAPRPKVTPVRAPPRVEPVRTPPPPLPQIELIRGDKKTTEVIQTANR